MVSVCSYPSEVQVSLLAVSPEEHGGARVGSGDGFAVDQQPHQDPHHQHPVQHPHQQRGEHPVQPALGFRWGARATQRV